MPLVCSTRTLLLIVQLFIFTDECGRCFMFLILKRIFLCSISHFLLTESQDNQGKENISGRSNFSNNLKFDVQKKKNRNSPYL